MGGGGVAGSVIALAWYVHEFWWGGASPPEGDAIIISIFLQNQ